ncbi:hypothetical protein FSPOR_5931 [Fusarium sporotrichioides]|uniref:FAD-binding PCMH-type domain-containing protein n=1 Tax=Fusarium sporotrichioides TaxID=5514 RepID=A0A395S5U8_FUSSP|nr:hypothetical protein FSPOR_5931 [Fusarium sporotrichioides]
MQGSRLSWLLAALVPFTLGQTIDVDGEAVPADESNVAPAWAESMTAASRNSFVEKAPQLTDAVLANLTELNLSDIELFYFADTKTSRKRHAFSDSKCKIFPGDKVFPGKFIWNVLDLLTGGALISTVPLGSACYKGEHYDEDKCLYLKENWHNSTTHIDDPTSVMSPLFQGATCEPSNAESGSKCTIGGFPLYSIKATNVAQIQLAVNFARSLNLRLVVHNTGHDFLGKSTGAGALSIWTHHLKDIKFTKNYRGASSYTGPAFKLGAGVQVKDLYEAADREGYTAVGGECRDVGVTGGYLPGGGHSPLSPIAGLAADQLLSADIVTPDGRFVTADEKQNTDLFWAIRGGGPATWGVVVSMTVRVYPKMSFAGMTWSVNTKEVGISEEALFKALEAYWRRFPEYSDKKSYGYSFLFPAGNGSYLWTMNPWMIPNISIDEFKKMVQPLLDEWKELGVDPKPEFFQHDSFYPAWKKHFPAENVGNYNGRSGSRLIPRKNWDDPKLLDKTIETLKSILSEDGILIIYNINAKQTKDTPPNAANPAWRDANMFVITALNWDVNDPEEKIAEVNNKITFDIMERLKAVTPGGGGYGNEGDVMDPDFGQSYFGSNYQKLYQLKQKIDPYGVFYAPTAVGSEDWYITGQPAYVTKQTGRLCRK